MRIGFAGAGNMAAAMARGWAAGPGGPDGDAVLRPGPRRAPRRSPTRWAARRGTALGELAQDCDVLLLAVKPAALDAVAEELGGKAPALLSMLAVDAHDAARRGVSGRAHRCG